ncbi:hypothetical protein SAMD00079811_76650 (plasmid) [Scytonema sp. HK-05]|uniref:hypothetical protein n=1 Tax=Scytonema sp. HK-05 TaxID=1137095 RepID=UPI00093749B9|nr:hypothetical protein [Scytonema sp. HK-05]OKH53640.1 hypothetical protein NIES2130_30195 [Scytonema sp. HK-05]BAY50036.1 hypothetical protein SAMD00079811_76650 [Scytonema sp. HK-05]
MVDIEWVQIASDKVVVATAERAWLHQLDPAQSDNRFAQPMVGTGSVATTQKLLDGFIAFAKTSVSSKGKVPTLNRWRWVWRLASSYHLCHPTSRLMEQARERFAASGRKSLAQWAAQKAREERNHDQLALLDIESMGYKALAVVEALVPPAAVALIDYFTRSAQATDPINCVGYSYTIERLALRIGEKYIQSVETKLPPGTQATRCLRVHSGVGSDVEHVKETVQMVADLAPHERTRVAIACYETALLCFSPPNEGYISDEELQNVLKPLESHTQIRVRSDFQQVTK